MADEFGADGFGKDDDALQHRQGAKLFPVGQALRATYDADNHATLSKDVTGLMLDLAHVPFEPHEFQPLIPAAAVDTTHAPQRAGWLARIRAALRLS